MVPRFLEKKDLFVIIKELKRRNRKRILRKKNMILGIFYEMIYCKWNGVYLACERYEWVKSV